MGSEEGVQLTSRRAAAVIHSICVDAREIGVRRARLSRAVANAITEVLIGAETGNVS